MACCMIPDVREATFANAQERAAGDLPADTLGYLLPSRYCESDTLAPEALRLFGALPPGWSRVQAICDFVNQHVKFGYEFARSTKTALETYQERQGVCRDFAHLTIAFCRALNIRRATSPATWVISASRGRMRHGFCGVHRGVSGGSLACI